MNPENPIDPRQALEPSLTALLLGELPDEQARFIRQAIATDPELAKTFERLKKTTALIRQTEAGPGEQPTAAPVLPKLSEARRQELLRRFKTVQPEQFRRPPRTTPSWLLPVAAAAMITLALASLLLPALSRSKSRSMVQREVLEREELGRDLARRKVTTPSGDASAVHSASVGPVDTLSLAQATPAPGQNNNVALQYSQVPGAKGSPQAAPATPAEQSIILPTPGKSEPWTVSAGGNRAAANWGFDAQSGKPVSLAGSLNKDTTFAFSPDGRSLGGTVPQEQQQTPVLGDIPVIGRLFLPENDLNRLGLARENQTPLERSLKEDAGVAGAFQQRDYFYQGGAFGGYSTITPKEAQIGQRDATNRFDDSEKRSNETLSDKTDTDFKTFGLAGSQPKLESELAMLDKLRHAGVVQKQVLVEARLKLSEGDQTNQLASANAPADELKKQPSEPSQVITIGGMGELPASSLKTFIAKEELLDRRSKRSVDQEDLGETRLVHAPMPQPEVLTKQNTFSTFSLNVSDVSFKLAAASLEQGKLPDPAGIRSEEFINAFDYRDPEPTAGQPVAFAWERTRYPFAQNRDLLRFSIKTAAAGRQPGRPLNIVLLLDNSGSMERADRVQIIHQALRVLAGQLQTGDTLSVVTFARTPRLWVDGVAGDQAGRVADELSSLTPQGGTNLEEAMNLAYQTALRHYLANGINRVVLLTDGAANLGDTDPEVLKKKVEANRKQGVALDCFGIGWEGYNDDLLEVLTRNGDGRYGFLNTPEEAATEFAGQLAGALHVAASDVKVQVEFNPNRVTSYRQIGYARHQLTKEQFRDNTVDAAEIGAAESGNALYVIETNPQGNGPIATVRVRYKVPGTADYQEHEWTVPYAGNAAPFEQASAATRLAGTAAAFSEWLAASPYAAEIAPDRLTGYLSGVSAVYGVDPRPQKLEWMLRQAQAISKK